jgi:hypothetical protein
MGVKRERFAQFVGAPFDLTVPAESQTWAEVILLDLNAISAREYRF